MATAESSLSAGESITYSSGNTSGPPVLRFIHYNDVYHVEPGSREPVGGIARFQTLCNQYQHSERFKGLPDVLTFFSGDAFSPSLESTVSKGAHMISCLNGVRTNAACLGNHELDFGIEQFERLSAQCNFPWLCANVLDPALGENVPLGHCKRTAMLESSDGIKIGVIGLVEKDWLDTINTLPPNLDYLSASATAAELASSLRADGAEMIVCVTHQREVNDNKLASTLEPGTVDLILGGHDHFYGHSLINGTHVMRSGTDFKQLSYLECRRRADGAKGWDVNIFRRDIVSSIPEEPSALAMVEAVTTSLKSKLEKPIGYTLAPLDARFTTVRLKESNLANFVCDLMRFHYDADCCIMAAGTIRGDQIYPPGVLRVKDIMNCFPFEDPCVVVGATGSGIVGALENGVGQYPSLEGRFPQVSNITFTFDTNKQSGRRCSDIRIGGEPIDLQREYIVATRDYMVRGKDGYTDLMLEGKGGVCRSIVGDESGHMISMMLRQYFMSLKILGRWKSWDRPMGKHWKHVQDPLHQVHPVHDPVHPDGRGLHSNAPSHGKGQRDVSHGSRKQRKPDRDEANPELSDSEDDNTDIPAIPRGTSRERELLIMRKVMRKWWRVVGMKGHPNMCDEKDNDDHFGVNWTRGIAPRVEGRIRIIGPVE